MKLALVASSGGHLAELHALQGYWSEFDRFWVSFPTEDAQYLLKDETKFWAHYPTNRSVWKLMKNIGLAWKLLRKERPDVVLSTGAGVGVAFLVVGRILGIRTVYIESLARIHELSMSGRLVYRVVDEFFVQWPELEQKYSRTVYRGRVT
jgi:UDP-N-acetylglucosamine:LPS N-acetylglucosamine transferase